MNLIVDRLRLIAKKVGAPTLTFLGTGPNDPITDRHGKSNRKNSSVLLNYKGARYLIDIGPTFDPDVEFDYLLLTHLHRDAFGGFGKIRDRDFVLAVPQVLSREISKGSEQILKIDEKNELGDLTVTPFRVEHDVAHHYPTFGYQFLMGSTKLTYASDMVRVPKSAEGYFDGIDVLVTDGAGWRSNLATHFGVLPFLNLVKNKGWKIGKIYFTQIGRPVPDYEEAQDEIKKVDGRASLTYDGQRFFL